MAFKTSATSPKLADVVSPEIEELFLQVYANPDDVSARLVLSDALIELRNPRGEFIVIQFGRASGRAVQNQKEQKLLRRFQEKWLMPFGKAAQFPVFERGFLARCTVLASALNESLIGAREWSTVHSINCGGGNNEKLTPFLLSDPIRNWTRRVESVPSVNAAPVLASPLIRRWRSMSVVGRSPEVSRAMALCMKETMPELKSFELRAKLERTCVERMIHAPLAGQLDELSFIDDANGAVMGLACIRDILLAPERPKRISITAAAGMVKIDLRGDLEGQMEIGLLRSPPMLIQMLEALKNGPIKSIRILHARDDRYRSVLDGQIKELRTVAERIAPVKMELIP